jgi:hypothetical protein
VALNQERKNTRWRLQRFNPSALVPLVVFGDGMKNKDTVRKKYKNGKISSWQLFLISMNFEHQGYLLVYAIYIYY